MLIEGVFSNLLNINQMHVFDESLAACYSSSYCIVVCYLRLSYHVSRKCKKGCHNVTALHVFINNCQISTIRY